MTRVHHDFLSYFPSYLFLSSPFFLPNFLPFAKPLLFVAVSSFLLSLSPVTLKYTLNLIPISFSVSILTRTVAFLLALYWSLFCPSDSSYPLTVLSYGTSFTSRSNRIRDSIENWIFGSRWIKQMVNMIRECGTLLEWPVKQQTDFALFLVVIPSCYSALFSTAMLLATESCVNNIQETTSQGRPD